MVKRFSYVACLAGIAVSALAIQAADLIKPTAIAFKTSEMTTNGGRLAIHTIDGTGMSSNPATISSTHSTTNTDMWITAGEATSAIIAFDLGKTYSITKTIVWNYNEIGTENKTNRGVKDVEISVTSDADYNSASWTSLGTVSFSAGGTNSQSKATVADDVRLVKFDVKNNNGGAYVGLSEVRFEEAAPVPVLNHSSAPYQIVPKSNATAMVYDIRGRRITSDASFSPANLCVIKAVGSDKNVNAKKIMELK